MYDGYPTPSNVSQNGVIMFPPRIGGAICCWGFCLLHNSFTLQSEGNDKLCHSHLRFQLRG